MRLTTYSDYALRVLMYLALKSDGLSTIAEIAGSYKNSEAHLMKVVHQLGVAGYIETVRGRGGGLRLAKPAEAIGWQRSFVRLSRIWRSCRASNRLTRPA